MLYNILDLHVHYANHSVKFHLMRVKDYNKLVIAEDLSFQMEDNQSKSQT